MDDLAILLAPDSSIELTQHVQVTCAIVVNPAKLFGLAVNFAPGKTEVLFHVAGRGVVAVKRALGALEVAGAKGPSCHRSFWRAVALCGSLPATSISGSGLPPAVPSLAKSVPGEPRPE